MVRPDPVMTVYIPSGRPASARTSANISVVADVTSDGLTTIVQSEARMKGTLAQNQEEEVPRCVQANHTNRLTQHHAEQAVAKTVVTVAVL